MSPSSGEQLDQEGRPPSWYWWVVNIYQPSIRDLRSEMRDIQKDNQAGLQRLERMLWGLLGLLVAGMGGVITILVEVHK